MMTLSNVFMRLPSTWYSALERGVNLASPGRLSGKTIAHLVLPLSSVFFMVKPTGGSMGRLSQRIAARSSETYAVLSRPAALRETHKDRRRGV